MKKILFVLLALVVGLSSFTLLKNNTAASTESNSSSEIQFENITLQQALTKAKKENKKVFLYAYTDWCKPCKMMQNSTYKDPKVAQYFNQNFINLKVEVEKDKNGPAIAQKYGVRAHPCLLFLNTDGSLKTTILGYYKGNDLLNKASQIK